MTYGLRGFLAGMGYAAKGPVVGVGGAWTDGEAEAAAAAAAATAACGDPRARCG